MEWFSWLWGFRVGIQVVGFRAAGLGIFRDHGSFAYRYEVFDKKFNLCLCVIADFSASVFGFGFCRFHVRSVRPWSRIVKGCCGLCGSRTVSCRPS